MAKRGSVFLGTAGWGQKVTKKEAFRILETYYNYGFRWIDTATNYPIDGNPENYGKTLDWLSDFYSDFPELKVFVKVGSATNNGGSAQLINPSYFALIFDMLCGKLKGGLGGIGVHWDNNDDDSERVALIDYFLKIFLEGYSVGLSGIAVPKLYYEYPAAKELPWIFQTNFSPTRSKQVTNELSHNKKYFPNANFYGYNLLGGISHKGLSNNENRIKIFEQLFSGTAHATKFGILEQIINNCISSNLQGIIIGPSNSAQCLEWSTVLSRLNFE